VTPLRWFAGLDAIEKGLTAISITRSSTLTIIGALAAYWAAHSKIVTKKEIFFAFIG
jgi:hypothetical protein